DLVAPDLAGVDDVDIGDRLIVRLRGVLLPHEGPNPLEVLLVVRQRASDRPLLRRRGDAGHGGLRGRDLLGDAWILAGSRDDEGADGQAADGEARRTGHHSASSADQPAVHHAVRVRVPRQGGTASSQLGSEPALEIVRHRATPSSYGASICSRATRSRSRPRDAWLLTVPIEQSSTRAVSASD